MIRACLAMLLWFCSIVQAHDVGVTRVEIVEVEPGRYVVTAQVPIAIAHRFPAPELPEGFELLGEPGAGVGTGGFLRFVYTRPGEPLLADETIEVDWPRDGILVVMRWEDGSRVTQLFHRKAGVIVVPLHELRAGSGSFVATARRYTVLGVEHILLGFDHLLFVLGLMLLVRRPLMLVKTITSFTVAHSITLALATLGLVHLPSAPVEAAIALSIVFLGAEAVRARRGVSSLASRSPWIVAFGFGLLHGLGFAGALGELGMAPGEVAPALLFFNIGVEIGQLMFVVVVLVVAWALRGVHRRYPGLTALTPAYAIGTVACYWFIERATSMFAG